MNIYKNFLPKKDFLNFKKEITSEYNYLLNLSVYSFTLEKVEELKENILKHKNEFGKILRE